MPGRSVSSTLSRIRGNEPRPDVDEAVVCGRELMARQLHQRDG